MAGVVDGLGDGGNGNDDADGSIITDAADVDEAEGNGRTDGVPVGVTERVGDEEAEY